MMSILSNGQVLLLTAQFSRALIINLYCESCAISTRWYVTAVNSQAILGGTII